MPWLNPLLPIILSISQAPLLVKLALTIFSSINWFSTFPWWPLVFLKLQTFQLLWHSRRTDHQTQRTRQQPLNSRLPQSSKRVRRHIVYVVTCRLRPTSAFHVTRTDPGTEAYEDLRNGLRVDLPVTFDAAPLDCAAAASRGRFCAPVVLAGIKADPSKTPERSEELESDCWTDWSLRFAV